MKSSVNNSARFIQSFYNLIQRETTFFIQQKHSSSFMQVDKVSQKDKKQFNHFRKAIHAHLKDFQKCRQWADINNWLHNLYKFLENKRYDQLPNAVLLAKRFAQCLTNTLPSGVHQQALKVYTLVMTNFDDQQNLRPLMSIGLFPFFEVSSSQLKFELLKIYQNFFLNEDGCLQMTISLMNALLTGLNENNEELAKRIFALCEKISKKYGYIWIDGAVWVNILKSSKVKIAGFKYFMKVFKDRDKQKNSKQELKEQPEQLVKEEQTIRQKKSSMSKKSLQSFKSKSNYLKEEQTRFLVKLYEEKYIQDSPHNRYPNFSTLVVNAIRSCLQFEVDSLAKRAALEHVSTYLRLSQNSIVSQGDALILVSCMLRVLTCKQFSLTRRVYLYLFDQPNAEGQYLIDAEQQRFQLNILVASLKRMLKEDDETQYQNSKSNSKYVESTLSIIQILIQDHNKLGPLILPQLSYDILRFLKANCFSNTNVIVRQLKKKVFEFNQSIIVPYSMIFLEAILIKVVKKQQTQKITEQEEQFVYNKSTEKQFIQVIRILDFYIYTLYKAKYQLGSGNPKGSIKKSTASNEDQQNNNVEITEQLKQICLTTIQKILSFLKTSKLRYEKLSYDALDFANKINTETLLKSKGFQFHENIINKIDDLISLQPSQGIYARLLTLHPSPKKQILLPFINEGAFAIVCIQNLLPPVTSNHKIELTPQEQRQIFYAIFKLLQCHLWQQQAFQFVKIFIEKYEKTFKDQIDKVEESQWIIYWRLAEGDVQGGVIRMILNAQSENPLKKHMSCKWIEANEHIISKVIEPISIKLKTCLQSYEDFTFEHELQRQIQFIYNLIKIVFEASRESFDRFFFLQKQKYVIPLLEMIFLNLELGNQKLKTKSMDMMKYVLSKAKTYQQKYDYMNLTLPRVLNIFKRLILRKAGHQDIQSQILQKQLQKLSRISSFNKNQTQVYLQQIQVMEYLANLNVSIKSSLKQKDFRSEPIIQLFESKGMYVEILKGLYESDLPYIRTLYLDFLKDSCDLLAVSQGSKDLLNLLVNLILQKIFLILKTQDVTQIEETIREKKQSSLKNSMTRTRRLSSSDMSEDLQMQKLMNSSKETSNSFYMNEQNITKNDMNIESKYAQIIEMWNSVKFYTKFSIKHGITNLPIVNLLSLILQSFPFSYLKYTQMTVYTPGSQAEGAIDNYELLQQQINKVTGLKKEVMEIIDIVWSKFNLQICEFLIERGDPRILIHCTIDPIKVLSTISVTTKVKQIYKYYNKSTKFNLPKTFLHYSGDMLNKQNQVCYFLYLYLMYCNFGIIANKKLNQFLEQLVNLFMVLQDSQHIQTKIWLLELIHLLSERILSRKQVYIEGGLKLRQELQQMTKQILNEMLRVITRSKNFTHRVQIKTGLIANLFSKEQKQVVTYDFIKMNPPTIFVMSQAYMKRTNKRPGQMNLKQKKQSFDKETQIKKENQQIESFLFDKWLNLSEESFSNYLSICCLKTLISISCPLILNIFEKDAIKVSYTIRDIVLTLLPICQDKSEDNQFRIELISEYIYCVFQNKSLKSQILPLTRRNIIAIFMGNDFFKTTKRSLFYWKQIIDACTQGQKNQNHDLLGELLAREAGLFQGLLKGKEEVLRQKIKSFERICFVIYSGRMDKYEGKLSTVLLFLNDVMKQENCSPALLILMLFCIRILFMRLSQTSLNKMFKSIWPGLISILIQIFSSKEKKKNRNINLILAALKVVQLVHALQMQEFNFHKWIFITDFFGIKIEPVSNEIEEQRQYSEILTPFIFKPYMTNLLPDHRFKCEYLPEEPKNMRQTLRPQKQKRKILIKQANIDTIEQVQNLAYILIQYMIDCNQKRVQVSKTEIQELIEADFISLDDYIFEVK